MNCFSFVYLFKPCRYTKAGRDGGSDFEKAWTINANASIKNDMGTQQYHLNEDGSRAAPIFDFTVVRIDGAFSNELVFLSNTSFHIL